MLFDEDFVFYGAPVNPGGTVRLLSDGPTEQTVDVAPANLPAPAHKVVIAAAIDGGATFGDVGAVELVASPDASASPVHAGDTGRRDHRTHPDHRRDPPPWPAVAATRRRSG